MSPYQELKIELVRTLGISRDAFHVLLGFLVFLGCAWVFKIKLTSYRTLIAPLIFGAILEIKDTIDALAYGFPVNLLDSSKDIIIALFIPAVLVTHLRRAAHEK
jgi:hypothetical protein